MLPSVKVEGTKKQKMKRNGSRWKKGRVLNKSDVIGPFFLSAK